MILALIKTDFLSYIVFVTPDFLKFVLVFTCRKFKMLGHIFFFLKIFINK